MQLRFPDGDRFYTLIDRDVYFGFIKVGSLPHGVRQPSSPAEATRAWRNRQDPPQLRENPRVVQLSDYRQWGENNVVH